METEIWKDSILPLVEVSNFGNFRTKDKYITQFSQRGNEYKRLIKSKPLSPVNNGLGYLQVKTHVDGVVYRDYSHRLVWIAFNGEIPDGYEVDHVDNIKSNCRLSNLQLLTRRENMIKCHKENPHILEMLNGPVA